ncbi:hypothetical protein CF319_g914 [Tilletia indica]|uniref:RRM domain-containing protein n=2 Tax=Tilletia TaxID=13289 RepID=A0A8X7NEY2_9BASI|nr:hypothetical protein CF327_g3654 [Tilletia walkeri]KAE8226518.1 hypothetical protein CF319_g914 [Tilletia indica]KAE8256336.1 hypothetical protein A4X13_0g2707 [Tilletia indica]KAE8270741.1 hypothetical protein A4X09_0g1602 [Tilletia walkeri]
MSSKLDQSLSDIIASKPKTRAGGNRGGKGGAAAAPGRKRGSASTNNAKAQAVGASASGQSARNSKKPPVVIPGRLPPGMKDNGSKVIVSNLPLDVTEQQVKELFSSTIGPLKKVIMSFRANGQSTGNCTVEFQRAEDGNKAYNQYNNRLIDGKRQLRIEVVVDPAKAAQLLQVAQPAARGAAPARGGAAARGRGGRAGAAPAASKPKRVSRPKKSAEDLDAEMEDYAKNADKPAAA